MMWTQLGSQGDLNKSTNSFDKGSTACPSHLPKAPPPNVITLKGNISLQTSSDFSGYCHMICCILFISTELANVTFCLNDVP